MRIIVVGGGVVGLTSCIALARERHEVTLFDSASDRSAASWNNAGHIAIEQVTPLASLSTLMSAHRRMFVRGGALDLPPSQWRTWLPFAARMVLASRPARHSAGKKALRALLVDAMPAWSRLIDLLNRPDLLRCDGHLIVWESGATARSGRAAWARADVGTASVHAVDSDDMALLARLSGDRGMLVGAIRFEGSGQIVDLDELADALETAARDSGVRFVAGRAEVRSVDGRAEVAGCPSEMVIVAAGVASGGLMRVFGHRVPMAAERGYHIRSDGAGWPVGTPPVVFEDRSMILTRFRDVVQASSFVEIGEAGAPPDQRKWERLEAHVAALGLPMDPPFSRWMGARPTLPDYLPAIGRSRRASNLIYAFGHQHLGLTLAPRTAELVAQMVSGHRPSQLTPFDIERFGARGGVQ